MIVHAKDTLILVAPQHTSVEQRDTMAIEASNHHDGPVLVLAHGWVVADPNGVRRALDDIESRKAPIRSETSESVRASDGPGIGPSVPPPPPPPPNG